MCWEIAKEWSRLPPKSPKRNTSSLDIIFSKSTLSDQEVIAGPADNLHLKRVCNVILLEFGRGSKSQSVLLHALSQGLSSEHPVLSGGLDQWQQCQCFGRILPKTEEMEKAGRLKSKKQFSCMDRTVDLSPATLANEGLLLRDREWKKAQRGKKPQAEYQENKPVSFFFSLIN